MEHHQIPIILSSASENGARNISPGKDRFEVLLDRPIKIPANAKTATIELNQASVWNSVRNISVKRSNNTFVYREEIDVNTYNSYPVTIDDGLYDLDQLSAAINRQLVNPGLDSDIITFNGDDATQKVIVRFSKKWQQIDLRASDSCSEILGFKKDLYHPNRQRRLYM
jgi:hypothetical protein